jgi:hypothetical protein
VLLETGRAHRPRTAGDTVSDVRNGGQEAAVSRLRMRVNDIVCSVFCFRCKRPSLGGGYFSSRFVLRLFQARAVTMAGMAPQQYSNSMTVIRICLCVSNTSDLLALPKLACATTIHSVSASSCSSSYQPRWPLALSVCCSQQPCLSVSRMLPAAA